jgi:hypothetical protein
MFDHRHYVPVLKGLKGEYDALSVTPALAKAGITPLIEVPPIPWDFSDGQPAKTIDQHLQKVADNIRKAWGADSPAFVDLVWIGRDERVCDGAHPLNYVFQEADRLGLQLIPVTDLARDDDFQRACRGVARDGGLGACLRLQREDFEDVEELNPQISTVLQAVGTSTEETDLVLDLRALGTTEGSALLAAVPALIRSVPRLQEWRSFALAGTGFPPNLTGLPQSRTSEIPRLEWILWSHIIARSRVRRLPAFGDYAICHVQPPEVDPRVMKPSASIRYTTDKDWLVVKGRNLREYSFDQFYEVCRNLIARPEYCGPAFSWGDWFINECADGRRGPGNLTTWRQVGTSHHLAFVVNQIANLA